MNITNLSLAQLKEVVAIKEQIAGLETKLARLNQITSVESPTVKAPAKKTRKGISAAGKAKIAAAAKSRWAKVKGTTPAPAESLTPKAAPTAKPIKKRTKRVLSPEGRAKIVAAMKKRWAAKKK